MLQIAVIADDLTGAADTGVQFCRLADPNYLLNWQLMEGCALPRPPAALSIYTDSRRLPAQLASRRVRRTARALKPLAPRLIYKKIDSCLRGNLAVECLALLDELELDLALVAPALPWHGRQTIHDQHLVHGVPVAQSEMGRDPVSPVRESRLSRLLAGQSGQEVGHLDLDLLEQGPQALKEELQRLRQRGIRLVAADAVTQEHLQLLAGLGLDPSLRCLLVGSAGLALSLADIMQAGQDSPPASPLSPPILEGHLLLVCGSASPRMAEQVEHLIRNQQVEHLILKARPLMEAWQRASLGELLQQTTALMRRGHLALKLEAPSLEVPLVNSERLARSLAELAARAALDTRPGALFISGGDTAGAVLEALGSLALELKREFGQGNIWSTLRGGPLEGTTIFTRAGAFGQQDALTQLLEQITV